MPPPGYSEGGTFVPPRFPLVKSRERQIDELKRSAGVVSAVERVSSGGVGALFGIRDGRDDKTKNGVLGDREEEGGQHVYDLLVIGSGATGSGIALDAATRGLRVAVVERDDFGSGTSSKSTKLVHGGVRYLEKAVWEADYNQ